MTSVLEIENLTKQYKNGRGANDISFSIGEGEIVGLLGPNGSGKTTVMKCIAGFHAFDSGIISVFGNPLPADAAPAGTGFLIEQPALYENLTAQKQLKMMTRLYPGLPSDTVENLLKDVGLERYGNEKVRRFSLGMKQRLGIAMAFLSDPGLVILDEPNNGLDIEYTVELRNTIIRLAREKGKSFLVSGHQADEIEKLCDRVVILSDGRLIDDIAVSEALRFSPSLEDYFLQKIRSVSGGASC